MPETRRALRIVIPGGTGQIGRVLARHFHEQGNHVTVLSRRPSSAPWQSIAWDGCALGDWVKEIDGADVVINLAGRTVNCRYNQANRREIMDSRIDATKVIGHAIAQANRPPQLWMNMSTATIYRHVFDRAMDEDTGELGGAEPDAPPAWRFSIEVATRWEQTFFDAPTSATRKIALRTAMVMGPEQGGIFATLLNMVRARLGGKAASGKQFISWIHEQDFVRAMDFLIARTELASCVNIAAPAPLPNSDFMRVLRQAYGTRIGLPASRWMLEIGTFLLRSETELVLKSRRVVPSRLLQAGFTFAFPDWEVAARDLVRRWRDGKPVMG